VAGRSRSLTRARTSATGASGAKTSGWEVIRPPAQVLRLHRLHRGEQPLPLLGRHFTEQVGGVVRLHFLDDIGAALVVQAVNQPDLVLLRHLLEQVGQLLVIEGGGELAAPGLRKRLERVRQVGGGHLAQAGELLRQRSGLEQFAAVLPGDDLRTARA
jgi:hypothetical protein